MRIFMRFVPLPGCLPLMSSEASACPFCDSPTAAKVRDAIFNEDFGYHVIGSLAPFPILAVVLALIYYAPLKR